jgi:protein-tyrosine phosphatase
MGIPSFMVDIHSHILWGLDDGAKTLEDSIAMARIAAESGTTDIVATPHANNQYTFDPVLIQQRVAELASATGGRPNVHFGSDFHLSFSNIESALQDPRPYTINHLRYLMVELPDSLIPPDMGGVFERMKQVGILPVITHPERNRAIWRDVQQFENWLEIGCYVQITAQSLEGHFGRTAKQIAWRLIEEDRVHFVASDGHDTSFRPPRLDRAYAEVVQKHSVAVADRLFRDNPRAVLEGAPIALDRVTKKPKSRFRLFGRAT